MKCDNYSWLHSGLKPGKPDDHGKLGSRTPPRPDSTCKDCAKSFERSPELGSLIVSPRILELEAESKPLHNKENQRVSQTLGSSSETEELESCGSCEDSGYASFSQHSVLGEHEEGGLPLEESLLESPQPHLLRTQSSDPHPTKNLLPALHFAQVVCSTLKKNAKRNPKKDWDKLKECVPSGTNRLQNLIGRKMGLEYVDILSELFGRGLRHVLKVILTQLSDMDFVNVSRVSKTWKKLLEEDKGTLQLYNKAIQRVAEKSIKLSLHASTREYVVFRTPLASVQKSAAQLPPPKDARTSLAVIGAQKSASYSRHNEFSEVAKTLKKNESLKACVRCNSPAKYDCYLQRATCKREGCGFDYCTKCLCNYHTTKDCSNGKSLKASYKMGPLPGTKRSKNNLRRL